MENNIKVFSLDPIIDANSQILILGSMPGKESLAKKQYYGNPRNHFWKIICSILKLEVPSDYQTKVEMLKEHKIALWDVIHECERIGSLDSDIKNEEPNNFEDFFKAYPHIKFVGFNGSKAFNVFKKNIGLDILADLDFKRLSSTSPTPGKNVKSYEEKVEDWSILKKYLSE